MERVQQALTELEQYHLLGPGEVVEALQCLERVARSAVDAELSWPALEMLALWIMDEHWLTQGLPRDYLAVRRAEVLLRLSTMFELLQARRWEEQISTTW